jgi:Ala-tRNA(Pro) deacylase
MAEKLQRRQSGRATLPPAMPAPHATPDQLFATFDRLGIPHRTVSHPPLFTVAESQTLRGKIPGGHTKNLFLRTRKTPSTWW